MCNCGTQVTNENKQEYANLAARQKMTTSIKEPIEAFQAGLWEVVPLSLLRLLSHAELELLLSGLPDIDVHDLRRNTAYAGGLTATDRLVQWFWSIVEDMDKQDVALLLQFVTGAALAVSAAAARLMCALAVLCVRSQGHAAVMGACSHPD